MSGKPISAWAVEKAMSAALQAKAMLPADDDAALILGTLEGETDIFALMDRLAEQAIADKLLAERAAERARRIERRAAAARDVLLRMLEALDLPRIERPVFTASLTYPRKAVVTDADALPEAVIRRAPDMQAINKLLRAGEAVPGAELSNPAPVLNLRTV